MAGHSQFKNIMHRKGAQDAKRAKVFTKLIREITVATQMGGPDRDSNPRLRTALQAARAANMPKDTVERAIKKGSGESGDAVYSEMRYEGYDASGVAMIVEALTDNRNRTAADVRALFNKHGGRLGETGSVTYLFTKTGLVFYPKTTDEDALLTCALDNGAEDFTALDDAFQIATSQEQWMTLKDALEKDFGPPVASELAWIPNTTLPLAGDRHEKFAKLISALEDNDDVQTVWHNAESASEI
jgi:YebC/PmpR family DNA-binding regulatory protein